MVLTAINAKQALMGSLYKCLIEGLDYTKVPYYPLLNAELSILKWNITRGNIEFDELESIKLYDSEDEEYSLAKEQFDISLTCKDKAEALYEMVDAECDKFVVMIGILAKSGMAQTSLSAPLLGQFEDFKQIPNRVRQLGFNFLRCIEETIKEIDCRIQDPEQKSRWEAGERVSGEKWKKWEDQPIETKYKADYFKYKLDNCGCA